MGNTVKEAPVKYTPRMSDEAWQALKMSSIRGVPDCELSVAFGVTEVSIRKRRSRDKAWKAACNLPSGLRPGSRKVTEKVTQPPHNASPDKILSVVTASLESIAQANPLLAARAAHEAMQRSVEQGLLPDPSTWQEFATANKLVRTNTGLDKAEGTVTLNLWSGSLGGDGISGGIRDVSEPS